MLSEKIARKIHILLANNVFVFVVLCELWGWDVGEARSWMFAVLAGSNEWVIDKRSLESLIIELVNKQRFRTVWFAPAGWKIYTRAEAPSWLPHATAAHAERHLHKLWNSLHCFTPFLGDIVSTLYSFAMTSINDTQVFCFFSSLTTFHSENIFGSLKFVLQNFNSQ